MAIELTQEEAKILSQMSYMNNLNDFVKKSDKFNKPYTLQKMATELLKDQAEGHWREFGSWGSFTDKEQYDMLKDIAANKYPGLSNLKIKDYENHEGGDNFVGYAFSSDKDPKDVVCAFRGTMGSRVGDPSDFGGRAWTNNYNLASNNASLQFGPTKDFVEKNKEAGGKIIVTGHSQGGADAMYACATIPGVTGCVFDGPGIGQTLTPDQNDHLAGSSLINIVNQYDPVGAGMFHPEKRIFAQHFDYHVLDVYGNPVHQTIMNLNNLPMIDPGPKDTGKDKYVSGPFQGHYLQTIHFGGGNVIQGERSQASYAVENISKAAYLKNKAEQLVGIHSLGDDVKELQKSQDGGNLDAQKIADMQHKYNVETMKQYALRAAIQGVEATVDVAKMAHDAKTAIAADAKQLSDTVVEAAQKTKTAITTSNAYKTVHDIGKTIYDKLTPTASAPTEAEQEAAWKTLYLNMLTELQNCPTAKEAQEKINVYQNQGVLDQFRTSNLNVDNDIKFITDTLQKSDTNEQLAAWNTQYRNMMDELASSPTLKEAQEKINTYQNQGVLDQFRTSNLNVDNDIKFITDTLQKSDAAKAAAEQQQLAAWHAQYLNMLKDIQNSPTREDAQEKINYYRNQGALNQYRASNLNVDNDIKYITNNLQAKDQAQSFCNKVIQDVQEYAQNNTFFTAIKQKVQGL